MTGKPVASARSAALRYFGFVNDKSSKLWEVRVSGASVDDGQRPSEHQESEIG